MKRRKLLLTGIVLLAVVLGFSMHSQAALELRGTDSEGNRLIYDTDFDITWYDYTRSSDTWWNQKAWAAGLSVTGGDLVGMYKGWRLPTALNQDGSWCSGYDCTDSELGHLYFTELGNVAYPYPDPADGLSNTGVFQNLLSYSYWTGTVYPTSPDLVGVFQTHRGGQFLSSKTGNLHAIAVRPGDLLVATVPEPVSMVLFGVGAIVLGRRRMVLKRRHR